MASLQLRSAEQRESLSYRLKIQGVHQRVIATAARDLDLQPLTAGTPNLLAGIDAGGVALHHADRWWCAGKTPNEEQLGALSAWLHERDEFRSASRVIYATDSLARDYPAGDAFAAQASGVLAMPLGQGQRDVVLWFRPETISAVRWSGNPQDKPTVPGPHGPRLTPRKSFELFVESVRQRALPWQRVEIEEALALRVLILELVVTRAEQLAALNADLTRSNEELDAFAYVASHDLKEPLRGIAKYAHQLLESAQMDTDENRPRLEGLARLTRRMDSLLDSLLHFSRVGRMTLEFAPADLQTVVEEALEMVAARRQETPTDIIIPRPLPTIECNRVRVREIFVNLLSNALKYNASPTRHVEIGYLGADEVGERPNLPAMCRGLPIFYVRDNGLGIEPRHFGQIFKMFKRLHGQDKYGGGAGAGLTIVQKLVERHRGAVWLDSTLGAGTTFYFTLSVAKESMP